MSGSQKIKHLAPLSWLLAALLCLAVNTSQADELTLEVYETYHMGHRVADAISGIIKPGETLKVFGNKLIIRASDDTHEKIIFVLKEIDRAPKNLLISIRATDQYESKKRYSTAQLRYIDDSTVIHLDNKEQPKDGVIVYKGSSRDGKISMSVTSKDNLTTRQSNLIQQVRTLEGEQAYIGVGDEIPITEFIWANGSTLPITGQDSTTTGFYITPIISKGEILLDISFQQQERLNNRQQAKTSSNVSTKLRIPLNEWAPLAGTSHELKATRNGTALTTKRKGNQQQGIEIKVETFN
ncbi:MAG: hypothetical protein MI867_23790 [Pseudomonadales bacterium]|nr:hypothetical protein [Pseudomonadales bacterium]